MIRIMRNQFQRRIIKKIKGWRGSSLYQVFVPRFPKGGDVKAKRLQGVFVVQVLLKQGNISLNVFFVSPSFSLHVDKEW